MFGAFCNAPQAIAINKSLIEMKEYKEWPGNRRFPDNWIETKITLCGADTEAGRWIWSRQLCNAS
jgi:hypothetical protein